MVRFMRWKALPTRVVQSSGSSLSAIEVEPAMSANRTVIGRRSLTPAPRARSSAAEMVIPGKCYLQGFPKPKWPTGGGPRWVTVETRKKKTAALARPDDDL